MFFKIQAQSFVKIKLSGEGFMQEIYFEKRNSTLTCKKPAVGDHRKISISIAVKVNSFNLLLLLLSGTTIAFLFWISFWFGA